MGTEYPLPGDHRPLWEVFGRMYPIYHLRSKVCHLTCADQKEQRTH